MCMRVEQICGHAFQGYGTGMEGGGGQETKGVDLRLKDTRNVTSFRTGN